MRYDATQAECHVFTFKEGMLSAVAHDLELRVTRFEIEITDDLSSLSARFDPASLEVVGAVKGGATTPLPAFETHTIETNAATEVLDAKHYPDIRFDSTKVTVEAGGVRVRGRLALHGHEREVDFVAHAALGRYVGELTLHQPDFAIRPYSAMLGTLKIKPDVRVRISVPVHPRP